jgi:hypothetical protein
MDLTEVITRLVGPVTPVGDSHVDLARQTNLQVLCELTGELMDRIEQVANMPKDYRASVNKSKGIAAAFLAEIRLRQFAADVEASYKGCSHPTCGCEEGQCNADEFNDQAARAALAKAGAV